MIFYIYKLHPMDETEDSILYIGSTTNPKQRFKTHKTLYKIWKSTNKGYCSSFEVFEKYGVEQVIFSILEVIECETRETEKMREYETMSRYNYCINKNRGSTFDILKYSREYKRGMGRYTCECGSNVLVNSKHMHLKTQKHKNYIHQAYPKNMCVII